MSNLFTAIGKYILGLCLSLTVLPFLLNIRSLNALLPLQANQSLNRHDFIDLQSHSLLNKVAESHADPDPSALISIANTPVTASAIISASPFPFIGGTEPGHLNHTFSRNRGDGTSPDDLAINSSTTGIYIATKAYTNKAHGTYTAQLSVRQAQNNAPMALELDQGTATKTSTVTFSPTEADISQVVGASPPGTTFTFLSGVYYNLSIAAKTGDTFIGVVGADGSRQTIFSGAQMLSSFVPGWDGVWTATTTQTKPGQHAGSCQSGHPSCVYDEDLFYDGQPYSNVSSDGDPRAITPGEYYFDYANRTIYVKPLISSDDPNQHDVIYNRTRSAIAGASANGVTIENIAVEHYASPDQMGALGDQYPGDDWLIKNVEVRWNHGTGVTLGNEAQLINSYIHDNGQKGVGGNGANILVDGNEIAHNIDYNGTACGWECGGMKFVTTNLVVQNNYIHDNVGDGSWNDVDSYNTLYQNNLFANNSGVGVSYEISDVAIIRNNKFINNALCNSWLWCTAILIQNSQNVEVYGNTIVVASGTGGAFSMIYQNRGTGPYGPLPTQDNFIHDNDITFLSAHSQNGAIADYEAELFYAEMNPTNKVSSDHYHVSDLHYPYWLCGGRSCTWSAFQVLGFEVGGTIDYGSSTSSTSQDATPQP